MNMTLNPDAARRRAGAAAPVVANVYTKGGQALRVPLRAAPPGAGCAGHPAQQLMRWFGRWAAADPGFPGRVRSILLISHGGGCLACGQALEQFLGRYRLAEKLRLLPAPTRPSGGTCSCGCGCGRHAAGAPAGLVGEDSWPPLVSPGIPEGDGAAPSMGNSQHANAGAARRAAQTEADRLNAASTKVDPVTGAPIRYRFRVGHHPAKPPLQAHYHVVNEQGRQLSGHFFYGSQPARVPANERPVAPARQKAPRERWQNTDKGRPDYADGDYADILNNNQHRTEWHAARAAKAQGRQRRRMRQGAEHELDSSVLASLIHPAIDVYAQYALRRLLTSPDPGARADGSRMLAAVRSGQLRGIYQHDQQVPALRARRQGRNWWQVIPAGEDAVLLLDAQEPPLIDFRSSVRQDAGRLDPALRKAWRAYEQHRQGRLAACPLSPNTILAEILAPYPLVANTVPQLCQVAPACTPPSPQEKGFTIIRGIRFDFTLAALAFNPTARGVFQVSTVSPGKMAFSCHREAVSATCLKLVTPAWSYNAGVSTNSPQVQAEEWEFGFIQNVRRAEILHHYTNGKARKSVINEVLDILKPVAPGAPWFSDQSVQPLAAGQPVVMEDSPQTKAAIRLPGGGSLDQVCFSGVFDVWLVIRHRPSKTMTPVARKRIEFTRVWRLRAPTDDPTNVSAWVVLGGQREVPAATPAPTPPPALLTGGTLANQLRQFQELSAPRCPDPDGFADACIIGEKCLSN